MTGTEALIAKQLQEEKEKLQRSVLGGALTKDKFLLVCDVHKRPYGSKTPPNFKCKKCAMVEYVGLICNTPEEKRLETLDALESFAHQLLEAEKKGQIDVAALLRHPKVSINDKVLQ